MGLNEDEPQLMSLVMTYNRSRRVPGAWMKADAGGADNRQPLSSPAGMGDSNGGGGSFRGVFRAVCLLLGVLPAALPTQAAGHPVNSQAGRLRHTLQLLI